MKSLFDAGTTILVTLALTKSYTRLNAILDFVALVNYIPKQQRYITIFYEMLPYFMYYLTL
ncbi:MAG: hypothetical protein ACJAYN_001472 [Bermanella sp.]|jgi:hypothetical protein